MNKLQLNGTSIWDCPFMIDPRMGNKERLLYIYLLTSALSNIAGVYKISNKRICFDLDWMQSELKACFLRLKDLKKISRCGSYIIIKDASLFIQKPTKAIIKEWNKIIDNLPIKVKEKLERIKYKKIDGKLYKIEINQDEKPLSFEVNELKECYTKLLEDYKQRKAEDKIEDKIDGVQKESEGINPPKPIRKELIIEEEDERKKVLKAPEKEEIKDEVIKETVEDILKEDKKETEYDPSEWYFREEYNQHSNEINNEFTDEDDPYYVPTEKDYLKEWQENNFNYDDEADGSCIEEDRAYEEEIIEDEIIMDINCNEKDKVIHNIDTFMEDKYYKEAYKPIADSIIEKNNIIKENIGNKKIEYQAYFKLFCNVLETKNDDYLGFIILDFLQYKGFYEEANVISFARASNGEAKQVINYLRSNIREDGNKFYSKKAMSKLLDILYNYVENGEDKMGGLYCWYSDIRKKEKLEEKNKVAELTFA